MRSYERPTPTPEVQRLRELLENYHLSRRSMHRPASLVGRTRAGAADPERRRGRVLRMLRAKTQINA
jgi:hypothetical protein